MLLDSEVAARPDDAPVLAKFAKALVIFIKFWLTLGAFDRLDIKSRIAVASFGIFSIAFVELLYPSFEIPLANSATCFDVPETDTDFKEPNDFEI